MPAALIPKSIKSSNAVWSEDAILRFAGDSNAIEGYLPTKRSNQMVQARLAEIRAKGGTRKEIAERLADIGRDSPSEQIDLSKERIRI